MSGTHIIFLVLIAVTTCGAFVEASAYPRYRLTFARFIVALFVPVLWSLSVAFLPWEQWSDAFISNFKSPLGTAVFMFSGILLGIFGPVSFVGTIVIWVGASLCGDVQNWFKERIYKMVRKNT
jgi:hypothetical protein